MRCKASSGNRRTNYADLPPFSIALHSAFAYPGAQFYPSCIQVQVTGSGTAFPTSFVSFPGAYTPDTPGIVFDAYQSELYVVWWQSEHN